MCVSGLNFTAKDSRQIVIVCKLFIGERKQWYCSPWYLVYFSLIITVQKSCSTISSKYTVKSLKRDKKKLKMSFKTNALLLSTGI